MKNYRDIITMESGKRSDKPTIPGMRIEVMMYFHVWSWKLLRRKYSEISLTLQRRIFLLVLVMRQVTNTKS